MNSLTPLSCGCCGGPSRVNVAGLHLAVTFPCGWCGKVTMVRCPKPHTPDWPAPQPNDSVSASFLRWRS